MFVAAAPIVIGVLPLPQTPSGMGIDPPGMAIGAAVLGFNLLGDALRDALDPRHAAKSGTIEAPPSART